VKFNIRTAKGEATCIRIRIYSRAYMRWLRTGQNRTERNRMKRNSGERSVEARADCSRGAACLLAHLPVLNLYVVSATGSAIPLSHWRASPCRERKRERERKNPRYRLRKGRERTNRWWLAERERHRVRERYIFPGELRSRNRVKSRTNQRPRRIHRITHTEAAILTCL